MKKIILIAVYLFCFSTLLTTHDVLASNSNSPNIVFILSDDAGYADFGFQGSKIMQTPHLDQLAMQGMRFTQAYVSAAVCGPSRAGILTGKYQQRFGFEENNVPGYMSHSGIDDNAMGLPVEETTMGNHLQALGYKTAIIGKWHQGNADQFHPTKRGFDYFYGFRGGARSYFSFDNLNPNDRKEDRLERGFGHFQESEKYLTDALADDAAEFIQNNAKNEKPFLLFLSFNAVHTPMDVDSPDLKLFPQLTGKRQQLAAMTFAMDRGIGRVLDALKDQQIEESTLVIFTNDNGGPSDDNASNNWPLSGTKANHLEGGIRVPFLARWPNVIAPDTHYHHPISTLDLLPTFYSAAGGNTAKLGAIDGINLLPFLRGENTEPPHTELFWKKETRAAMRQGNWKLLRFPDRPAELYNIENDPAEQINLAAKHPSKVIALYKQLFNWELGLERPRWQLRREFEGDAMKRMDNYRAPKPVQAL